MDMSLCRRFGIAKPELVARLEKVQESVHVCKDISKSQHLWALMYELVKSARAIDTWACTLL